MIDQVEQTLGGQRPRLLRSGHDHPPEPRKQRARDLFHSLVAHRAINQGQRLARIESVHVGSQGACSGGIVGAVDDDLRIARHTFEPAGPFGLSDPILNRVVRHADRFERHGGRTGVLDLVLSGERTLEGEPVPFETAALAIHLGISDRPVARVDQRDPKFGGALPGSPDRLRCAAE